MSNVKLDVRAYPLENPKGSTMAFASVALNVAGQDVAAIRGIRVIEGQNGMFVSMPQSKREKEGEEPQFFNIAQIKDKALREELRTAVLAEYAKSLSPEYKQNLADREAGKQTRETTGTAADISVSVSARPLNNPSSGTKAFADVLFKSGGDALLAINGVRVVDGQKGLFVSMPQSKTEKDGVTEFHDVAFPLSKNLREKVSAAVLAEYTRSLGAERKQSFGERLSEGASLAERYNAGRASQPRESAAKKSPGLGD